ncbi:MAG: YdiU family protein [Marinosulfonomonas sp.]|nr:YdiU family protein [Marinosulfonomonas sp.]
MSVTIPFDNSYARLPAPFYTRISPSPVRAPKLVALNAALGAELGLDIAQLQSPAGVAVLSGSATPKGAEPLAQVYAGHQFGGFSPQLGDGRAMLLGEVIDANDIHQDIQLKGSGRTPYSRGGDGRAWLGPVLREYVVSEAMAAMGIPTTRALAAVTTGQDVMREELLPGAVLTRIATSHIRVGTFQFFAARRDLDSLQTLTNFTIARHYPDADGPMALFAAVVRRQASLIARWIGVGFIHGVMNTDNTHVGGITIDYGPCAFMDTYHPARVYSSIDRMGRYAFNKQSEIIVWNLAQLATSLIPLMGKDTDASVNEATKVLHGFTDLYRAAWLTEFRAKLGLKLAQNGDEALINDLLERMAAQQADFTNTFRALAGGNARDQFTDPAVFDDWSTRWQARLALEGTTADEQQALIRATSPALIPRNHRVEEMIQAAVAGDYAPFERLNAALAQPFEDVSEYDDLKRPPTGEEEVTQTFCGT